MNLTKGILTQYYPMNSASVNIPSSCLADPTGASSPKNPQRNATYKLGSPQSPRTTTKSPAPTTPNSPSYHPSSVAVVVSHPPNPSPSNPKIQPKTPKSAPSAQPHKTCPPQLPSASAVSGNPSHTPSSPSEIRIS